MSNRNKKVSTTEKVLFLPLNRLKKSPKNVRKVPHTKGEIKALAASIAAVGLLQNLVVEPEQNGKGRATGDYLVTAGEGRRLAQLLRVTRKEISKDEPIRCVLDAEHSAEEISLAENAIRTDMHPADQYEAFAKLHEQGMPAEDIAARFGVTAPVVKQRLRLGAVSPKLIQLYRKGKLDLDQLMGFTITDDHAKQERVWKDLPPFCRDRSSILNALTEDQIPSDDRRVQFIGAKAYEAAGGIIVRDLFDEEGGGFFQDADLVNRLVREKLQAKAEAVLREGWKWVEVEPEYAYEQNAQMHRVHATLSPEDQDKVEKLRARHECISEDDDFYPPTAHPELDRIDGEISAIERQHFRPGDVARAGAIVSLGRDGQIRIERGFVRPEDQPSAEPADDKEKASNKPDGGETAAASPLREKLLRELSAYRTSGLRHALAQDSRLALIAITHALAARLFFPSGENKSCLDVEAQGLDLSWYASGIFDTPIEQEMRARHERWAERLPKEAEALWEFIKAMEDGERLELLGFCVGSSVNVLRNPKGWYAAEIERHAGFLTQSLGLDMAKVWEPTVENYLGRVSKPMILEAVREGVSVEAAENISSLKKQAMAEAAALRLAGKGWLPAPLRTPNDVGSA